MYLPNEIEGAENQLCIPVAEVPQLDTLYAIQGPAALCNVHGRSTCMAVERYMNSSCGP